MATAGSAGIRRNGDGSLDIGFYRRRARRLRRAARARLRRDLWAALRRTAAHALALPAEAVVAAARPGPNPLRTAAGGGGRR
jgi:hypothetical protein